MRNQFQYAAAVVCVVGACSAGCNRAGSANSTTVRVATAISSPTGATSSISRPLGSATANSATANSATDTEREGSQNAGPRAVLEGAVFDFGVMEPLQQREHTFVIRNLGDAPLTIEQGVTSCKCTLGEVSTGAIPPGGQGTVTLTWRSGDGSKVFAHEAEILTNDPANPVLVVRVTGQVLMCLSAEPDGFSLPSVVPGRPAAATVVLSSQLWESFELYDLKSSLVGLTWDVQPLELDAARQLDVKSGYRIKIHLPDNLPRGYFSHWLRFTLQPRGESPRVRELPISGKVLRRVSIYGDGIDSTGAITLGKIPPGHGIKKYFALRVRDPSPEIDAAKIETSPEFLQAAIEPQPRAKQPGTYRLRLEIPASAPRAVHLAEPGRLLIKFHHPRVEDLELRVVFATLGASDL